MRVRIARGRSLRLTYAGSRAARISIFAAALVFIATENLQTAVAEGDTRTLSFHHVHTNEDITVTFKKNGRYDEAALTKLNWFMRDWRKDEQTKMDPQLFDVLWEAYRSVDATQPIQVICGYRSPETNSMLRARSSGVAQFSLHTHGDAMDFFIPGVPLEKIREAGLRLQRGGVGFYPSSGSPFVHLDTGSIRHWPRMSHDALARVFPDGKTVHVPSDGVPLAGYALALAEVERSGRTPSNVSLAAARDKNAIDGGAVENDREPASSSTSNVLASFFGFGAKTETKSEPKTAQPKPATAPKPVQVAAAPIAVAVERIIPMPKHRPAEPVAVAQANIPTPASRPGFALAAIESAPLEAPEPVVTAATTGAALAYAPEAIPAPVRQAVKPMGALPKTIATARPASVSAPVFASAQMTSLNNPWLRALMLTPNVSTHMSGVRTGALDVAPIREYMVKPAAAVTMAFSADPQNGLRADAFTGQAIVFVATTSFVPVRRTASLQ